MSSEFAAVFSQLRHDRSISQRQVAADLKISQALLSHYENGLREPRLDFVVRVCEYYGVSADYMLGRTAARENPMTCGSVAADGGEGELERKKNDAIRSFVSAVTVLFGTVAKTLGEDAVEDLNNYLGAAVYKIFRNVYSLSTESRNAQLSIPDQICASVCDAVMAISDTRLGKCVLRAGQNGCDADISRQALRRDYPTLSGTVEELIGRLDREIGKYLEFMETRN